MSDEDRTKRILYLREYRKLNRDRLIKFDRDRYAANPEYKRGLAKKWAKDNKERHNELTKAWRELNPDKQHRSERNWRLAHPEHYIAKDNKRRSYDNVGYDVQAWVMLKDYFGNKCLCCGVHESVTKMTVDHIIPVSKGGNNDLTNLQPLCKLCNCKKATKTTDYRNVKNEAARTVLQQIRNLEQRDSGQACNP